MVHTDAAALQPLARQSLSLNCGSKLTLFVAYNALPNVFSPL